MLPRSWRGAPTLQLTPLSRRSRTEKAAGELGKPWGAAGAQAQLLQDRGCSGLTRGFLWMCEGGRWWMPPPPGSPPGVLRPCEGLLFSSSTGSWESLSPGARPPPCHSSVPPEVSILTELRSSRVSLASTTRRFQGSAASEVRCDGGGRCSSGGGLTGWTRRCWCWEKGQPWPEPEPWYKGVFI